MSKPSLKRDTAKELIRALGFDGTPIERTVLATALDMLSAEAKEDVVRYLGGTPFSEKFRALLDPRDALSETVLTDLRTLRDATVARAPETLGAALSLCVSGNGEAWGVHLDNTPLTKLSCETSFGEALSEAAAKARELGLAR